MTEFLKEFSIKTRILLVLKHEYFIKTLPTSGPGLRVCKQHQNVLILRIIGTEEESL